MRFKLPLIQYQTKMFACFDDVTTNLTHSVMAWFGLGTETTSLGLVEKAQ